MAFLEIILMSLNMWIASLPGKVSPQSPGKVASSTPRDQQGANLSSAKYTTDLLTFKL